MKKGKVLFSLLLVIVLITLTACTEWDTTSDLDLLEDLLEEDVSGLREIASEVDGSMDELKSLYEYWHLTPSEEVESKLGDLYAISHQLEINISDLKHQIDDLESHVWEVSP